MARILVVDDDPDIRNLLGVYLKADGHTPDFADSGVTGMQAAARAVPDLILTDYQMPQMDGFALFSAIRSTPRTARVPAVMLTAHNSRALMLKALGMGLDDFLGKPITREELARVVGPLVPAVTPRHAPRGRYRSRARWLPPGRSSRARRCVAKSAASRDSCYGQLARYKIHHLLMGFSDETGAVDHAVRAVRCGLKVVLAAQRLKAWIARRFAGRDLPELLVAVGIHSGTMQAGAPRAGGEPALKGEAVEVAALLAESIPKLRWSVAASHATAQAANFQFMTGRTAQHAAVPTLPAPHERFQPLLDKLMAKNVAERFASVHDVIGFMGEARLAAKA